MAKLNSPDVVNREGGAAYSITPQMELFHRTATCLLGEPKFYESGAEAGAALKALAAQVAHDDPGFVLGLAAYARQRLNLRHAPIVLLVEAARAFRGKAVSGVLSPVRQAVPQVVKRADQLTDVVAYWTGNYGDIGDASDRKEPFPNALKKGLADAAATFDEWAIARYRAADSPVKLRDVLSVIDRSEGRPFSPALRKYLADGIIDAEVLPIIAARKRLSQIKEWGPEAVALVKESRAPWEVAISQFGNKGEVWEAVIPHMGYFAMLRNLRNMDEALEGDAMEAVLEVISDPERVAKSRILPFRFYQAAKMTTGYDIREALQLACEHSVGNFPRLSGKTAIAIDLSGSMGHAMSNRSETTYMEVAALMGMLIKRQNPDARLLVFASNVAEVEMSPDQELFEGVSSLLSAGRSLGGATAAYKVGQWLVSTMGECDRLILFSDMQTFHTKGTHGAFRSKDTSQTTLAQKINEHRSVFGPHPIKVFSVDMSGYGTAEFDEKDPHTTLLAGWSDEIIKLILSLEDYTDIVGEIRAFLDPAEMAAPAEAVKI